MVLDVPQSDPDPYLSSSSTEPFSSDSSPPEITTTVLPNFSALPQPFVLGEIMGYSRSTLHKTLTDDLTALSKRLRRPLTPSEAEAWAYHDAKGFRYASSGPPAGVAIALYRFRNMIIKRASDMESPSAASEATKSGEAFEAKRPTSTEAEEALKKGWAKKGWAERQKEVFKLGFNSFDAKTRGNPSEAKDFPFAEFAGQAAQKAARHKEAFTKGFAWAAREHLNKPGAGGFAWNVALLTGRAIFYAAFGATLGEVVMGTYGMTVAIVGKFQDPRLKTLRDESEKMVRKPGMKNEEKESASMRVFEEKVGGGKDPMGQGERTAAELWRNHRNAIGGGRDDASPTAGNVEGEDFFGQQQSDDINAESEARPRPRPIHRTRRAPFETDSPTPESTDFTAEYTSSTPSPSDGSHTSTNPNPSNPGESAWERVRRENASSSGRRRPGARAGAQQDDPENPGDSFSFSSAQGEKSYAKDEAQKRFDERMERERKGEDFERGSGRRRW